MKLLLLNAQAEDYVPGVVITAGYHVLLDKDQRVYMRTTNEDKARAEKDRLNSNYPHMGFIVEYHRES